MKTLKPIALSLSLALLLGSVSAPALAAQSPNKDLNVKMDVDLQCNIRTVRDVDVAAYTGAISGAFGSVVWQCTKTMKTQTVTVKINCGLNGAVSGTACANKMQNQNPNLSASYLNYRICTAYNCATPWPSAGRVINYSSTGAAVSSDFYIEVLSGQYTSAYGSYADTLTTTLIF